MHQPSTTRNTSLYQVNIPCSSAPQRILSLSCQGEMQIWQHLHQNNKVTKNEPQAVGRWKKYKSCFGFVYMVFGKVTFNWVRIAAKNLFLYSFRIMPQHLSWFGQRQNSRKRLFCLTFLWIVEILQIGLNYSEYQKSFTPHKHSSE